MSEAVDVIVVGAGAAGMMAAAIAGQRGRKVLLVEHAAKLAEKIRISGGGRCNFTNLGTSAENFISGNPSFCRSALARYQPRDFLALMKRHRIAWHEKHKGQLFCDGPSESIIRMLREECDRGAVQWRMPCAVASVGSEGGFFRVGLEDSRGWSEVRAGKLIVATGCLSIPKIGATDFGYRLGRQFGLRIVEPRPALVPLIFPEEAWKPFASLAGIALEVEIATECGDAISACFREDLLFTHRGLSGPAVLQASSYWKPGAALTIDLAPVVDLKRELTRAKMASRQTLGNVMAQWLPKNLAHGWLESNSVASTVGKREIASRKIAEIADRELTGIADALARWQVRPSGTEGFRKAEVTLGGIDTRELAQYSMEALSVPGLYFVGEVVDVTGWLGGYNFQWAWASGAAAGTAV